MFTRHEQRTVAQDRFMATYLRRWHRFVGQAQCLEETWAPGVSAGAPRKAPLSENAERLDQLWLQCLLLLVQKMNLQRRRLHALQEYRKELGITAAKDDLTAILQQGHGKTIPSQFLTQEKRMSKTFTRSHPFIWYPLQDFTNKVFK